MAQTLNDAAAEKSGSAEYGDGAPAGSDHVSNSQVHVGVFHHWCVVMDPTVDRRRDGIGAGLPNIGGR